jgi:alpha-tubulin suppressor-like RCC1 family protein
MAIVSTKLGASILAKGYVLPTTGVVTGPLGFNVNDKIVIDKNLSTKEENYVKNIYHDKILLNTPLSYPHDYHANIENRFQGLKEISDFVNPNAPSVSPPRVRKFNLSAVDPNNGSILIVGENMSNRTIVHQTANGSSSYEEIHLWAYNDDEGDVELTVEFGGLSNNVNGNAIVFQQHRSLKIKIPSRQGLFNIFNGLLLRNSSRITAFANEANKVTLRGYVNKINQASVTSPTGQSPMVVDSSCIGWGENFFGQASVPSDISSTKRNTIKSLAAGYNNSFAVLEDDYLRGWGSNSYGQLNVPNIFTPSGTATNLINSIEKISVGEGHVLALYKDNNLNTYVKSWGSFAENTVPINLGVVKDISAGANHSLALLDDGTVVGWGDNSHGQAKGVESSGLATGQFGGNVSGASGELLDDVVAVSAGGNHSLALRTDSGVVAFGSNYVNQCSTPPSATGVIQIAAGLNHSLILKTDGSIEAWGDDQFGQSTVPSGLAIANTEMSGVAAAGNASLAWTNSGQIFAWGGTEDSKLNTPPIYDVTNIYCGLEHAISTNISGARTNGAPVI